MPEQMHTDKSQAEIVDRVWELAEKIDFCMFTTWDGDKQRARPLSARVDRAASSAPHAAAAGARPGDEELERCRQIIREWTLRDSRRTVDEQGRPLR